MTWQTTRAEISAALSTVAGVTGYELRPTAPKAGDAWATWAGVERGPARSAWAALWRVIVILGPQEEDAVVQADTLLPDLVDTLSAVTWVDGAEPVIVTTDSGPLMALEITTRSE